MFVMVGKCLVSWWILKVGLSEKKEREAGAQRKKLSKATRHSRPPLKNPGEGRL
jgi:hypothetical protein